MIDAFLKPFGDSLEDPVIFGATMMRVVFGLVFLLAGVAKLRMGWGAFGESLVMGEGLLAGLPFVGLYGTWLPVVEFSVGMFLLLNVYTRRAFFVVGLLYISFAFGQLYDGNIRDAANEYLLAMGAATAAYYLHVRASGAGVGAKEVEG